MNSGVHYHYFCTTTRGENYRLMNQLPAALADFNRAIALKPDYLWAIAHRGDVYWLMSCYKEALADFDRVIEQNPTYTWAIAHRGAVYRRMKRYPEALADFNRAIELQPDYAWALAYRAQIHGLMGRYVEALADFDRAIALDETIISFWPGERALLLWYLGRLDEAVAYCELGLEKNQADHVALYTLIVIKIRSLGLSMDEIRPDFDRALALLPAGLNTPELRAGVLYRLGGLAALTGQTDRALNYLAEAVALEDEPLELARRDLAWRDMHTDPRFQELVGRPAGDPLSGQSNLLA